MLGVQVYVCACGFQSSKRTSFIMHHVGDTPETILECWKCYRTKIGEVDTGGLDEGRTPTNTLEES